MTHQTVQRSTLGNLQQNLSKMADLQAKMSSGKNINVPSDDPAGASDMLRLRGEQRAQTQFARNADDGNGWLTTVDSALTSSLTSMRRARDLVVQGGNGGLGATSREALAAEVDGLRAALLEQANTSYLGRSVFAGTSDAGVAFTDTYVFTGTPGSGVERRVAENTSVRVDADGAAVYGEGASSVFALLETVSATLRSGGDVTSHLAAMDSRFESMLTQVSGVGARQNRVQDAQSTLLETQQSTKAQLSAIEDVDLAGIILELQMQEVAYQGALGAAGKVLQPTLMEFLR
ncbi:flagellar hook-associated protein FlgL [Cellulomonas cellasea]|uniref:flagellar hook-associated protein FlgL n=1 Tax=Cellulomonas cellasea TaxID=43670 RepID=UPI001FEBFEF6|nr:flagellar hook-associated protein FlgL [Cellulomonas cellasea]